MSRCYKRSRKEFVLRGILSTDDVEDYAREQLEDGEWNNADFEEYNVLRESVGLCALSPYDE